LEDRVLGAFVNAFRTPDLRRKLLFVLFIIVLFRFGSILPAPGVDVPALRDCVGNIQSGGLVGILNLFSGGALLQLAVFALGIMPYITASIIMQLLTVVIPRLESLKKEGQTGQGKITQYTRYLTVGLAVLQSTTYVAMARAGSLFGTDCGESLLVDEGIFTALVCILVMTAGTGVIMWLGELITERGVGNGMSLLIFTQVVATFPQGLQTVYTSNGT
jgi:preprotein translocase subunit SecY